MSENKKYDLKGYVPSEAEEYMNPKHLEYFREKLHKWREELLLESSETVEHLRDEAANPNPDPNDRATVEEERSLELRTRDRYRKLINKINDALDRVENGSYGYCEETGEEIGLRRLEARPIATLSIEAQEKHERAEHEHSDD